MQYIHVHFSSIRLRWSFSRTPTWATKIKFLRKGLVGWLMCRPCWNCSNSRYRSLWKKNAAFFQGKDFCLNGFCHFLGLFTYCTDCYIWYRKIIWMHLNSFESTRIVHANGIPSVRPRSSSCNNPTLNARRGGQQSHLSGVATLWCRKNCGDSQPIGSM